MDERTILGLQIQEALTARSERGQAVEGAGSQPNLLRISIPPQTDHRPPIREALLKNHITRLGDTYGVPVPRHLALLTLPFPEAHGALTSKRIEHQTVGRTRAFENLRSENPATPNEHPIGPYLCQLGRRLSV